ncbi:MAG: ubiE/COQ5 methyltransferase family [Acidobacteria bacterium]|nr:ubiE/COQ5 methyltransferase family [Acidobacteriota bacterium]
MKTEQPASEIQKKFDFSPPRPRPFLTNLPARIDTYEEGVAGFFRWRTGLEYYATIDQVLDFVINTRRMKVVDLLTDTGTLALRLAGRKAFPGRVYSFDDNVTLLERARQRARHMNLERSIEFRSSENAVIPVADGFCELAISFFDFHRHPAKQFLTEAVRILAPEGHLILAEMLEPKSAKNIWKTALRNFELRWLKKNPAESQAVYYDKEEIIRMLFESGFRQVIIQELKHSSSPHEGVFSLIAATK